ncbi:response regulator transcription factor [Haloferula sp.]|uniref:response regulator transcription factor n=1 Tax=Haloferula sp. TaxID=2497595 RepID=UPI0032A0F4FD
MKLLVVEDDDDLRETLVSLLLDEGYSVDTAAYGEDGYYRSTNWKYDAVILDVMLPGMTGFEVLQRLRKVNDTPVLMLTARDGIADRVEGLDHGADDYLVKPFIREELLARIRAVVRRGGVESEKELRVGDVVLDTLSKVATVKGEDVELSSREFDMAEIMVRRRGEVVSRDFLYDNLFDENDESLSNMLDVYVYKLRRKLGRNFIRTRRGAGYQVD